MPSRHFSPPPLAERLVSTAGPAACDLGYHQSDPLELHYV